MSTEKAKTALEVFEAALMVAPAERSSWVEQVCGDDAALAAEVESLLATHREAGEFLESTPTIGSPGDAVSQFDVGEITPGQHLGDFAVERQIGAGGMGLVYRAQQISLNRPVALKVLPPYLRRSESARSRFRREVEAAARLRHPNIVAVFTTGEDLGAVYYAMELIDGPALNDVIQQLRENPVPELRSCRSHAERALSSHESTLSQAGEITSARTVLPHEMRDSVLLRADDSYFATVARLVADVASGLHYAHQRQVIHRDVKPSNLLFSADGEIHISDFGLARIAEEPGLTRTGEILGTPHYMAPEQIAAGIGTIDERTDIYALGATLYELLTLRPPYTGESRDQVISQISRDDPISPRAVNRLVPRDLDTICLKCLEKQSSRRYLSAGALAEDLVRYVEGRPISAQRTGAFGRGVRWMHRHRASSAVLLGMCSLAVAALFFAYRTHLSEARWTDAQFSRLFETAQLAALQGDVEQAEEAIDQAEQIGASPAHLNLLRGQLAVRSGNYQVACDTLELAVKQMPDSVAAHALLARAYGGNELHQKRTAIVNRLTKLKPHTLQDYLLLGQVQSFSDFNTSLATLNAAVGRDKTSVVARLVRGSVLVHQAMDSASADHAEAALDDLRIASELLEPNAHLLGRILEARLVAATAYGSIGDNQLRQRHLDHAALTADALKAFHEHYLSHRWRAFYHDYVGEDEYAVDAWREMKEWRIAYLVLTLHRLGEFDEALELCDQRLERFKAARFTEFFRSFILAATAADPQLVLSAFELQEKETLDPLNAHRFNYVILCLAGNLDAARAFSCRMRDSGRHVAAHDQWHPKLLDYTCGDLDGDSLLEWSAMARTALCPAHFFVGVTRLAQGDRAGARKHFQASADLKTVGQLEDHMSRALLAQLNRQPDWPQWIVAH